MIFSAFTLEGVTPRELDTEIKYLIASAKIDEAELLALSPTEETLKAALKILRGLKKLGTVQFFVTVDKLTSGDCESEYILNKYGEFIEGGEANKNTVFVKI